MNGEDASGRIHMRKKKNYPFRISRKKINSIVMIENGNDEDEEMTTENRNEYHVDVYLRIR